VEIKLWTGELIKMSRDVLDGFVIRIQKDRLLVRKDKAHLGLFGRPGVVHVVRHVNVFPTVENVHNFQDWFLDTRRQRQKSFICHINLKNVW
jgi:hypothetical protein